MALAYQSSTSLSSASSSAGAAGGLAASSGFGAGGAFDGSMTLGFFAGGGAMVCWPLAAAASLALRRPAPVAALRRFDAERRLVDELRPAEVVLVRRVEPARGS